MADNVDSEEQVRYGSRVQPFAEIISNLTPSERIVLAEALWDSLASTPDKLPVPPHHLEELRHRLQAEAQGTMTFFPWEEVRRKLLTRE